MQRTEQGAGVNFPQLSLELSYSFNKHFWSIYHVFQVRGLLGCAKQTLPALMDLEVQVPWISNPKPLHKTDSV